MQGCAALSCCSNALSSAPVGLFFTQALTPPFRNQSIGSSFPAQSSFNIFLVRQSTLPLLHCTATGEILEASETEGVFVETGYIYSVHGLQGEVRVKAETDFPELRFSKPGRRWLRQQVSGREMVQEIELVEGRGHPGQKSWILRFHEINTVEQKLPAVTASQEEESKHKILIKSPWEILQRPAGLAGIVTLLSSQNLVEHLHVMGVEYIQVCSGNQERINGEVLLGFTKSLLR